MKSRLSIWGFIVLTATYAALALTLPSDPKILEKYQITQAQSHLLSLTVVVPIVAIYLTALYGSVRVKRYALSLQDTKEGDSFMHISNGLTILAFSLPAVSLVSSLLSYISHTSPDLLPAATIARNYLSLIFPLVSFLLIERGASGLIQTLRNKTIKPPPAFSLLGVIVLSSLYIWVVTTRPLNTSGDSAYFLPSWLVIFSLAVPYLYLWCKGIMAAYYLFVYHSRVRGSVYKNAMKYLAFGIGVIVSTSVLIQMISTLSEIINRLDLKPILLILYLLIIFYALGYVLVARGAMRLKQIEEV